MDEKASTAENTKGSSGDGPGATILIVEDSAVQAELLRRALEGAGYTVIVAGDGAAALAQARANHPAVVVSDINMPVMDGYAMCAAIRREDSLKTTPVILLTMLSDPADVIRGLNAGADAYLTKPYNIPSLVSRIESLRAHPPAPQPATERRKVEVRLAGETHLVDAHGPRMLNLLISTYENAVLQNRELTATQQALEDLNEHLEQRVVEQTAALQDSERRYHAVFTEARDGIVLINAESGLVADCNPEFERQSGRSLAQLQGLHIWELRPPELQQRARAKFDEIKGNGGGDSYELPLQRPDGTVVPIEFMSTRLRLGERDYLQSTSRDITERKHAESALRDSEQNYRTLSDYAPALIWASGTDKLCNYFNRPWLKFTGRTLEQELGNGWTEGVHPDDFAQCLATYIGAFDRREPFSMEYRLRRDDGEFRWVRDDGCPRYDSVGEFMGYLGYLVDITGSKRQAKRTASLLDLSTSAETLDEKTLLQHGLDTMQHLTDSRIGFLHFVSEDQNEIELVTWTSDTKAHFCRASFDSHYPVSAAGIWADSIRQKQPVIINDYATAPGKMGLPEGHAEVRRLISVPIFEGKLVRMIVGVGNAARDYGKHDVETVKLFSYDLHRIIERKRAEDALRRSEKDLQEAQRIAQLGNWDWDVATDTITWSKEYYRIYGLDPTQRPPGYADHLRAYTPESAERLDAAVKRNLQTGQAYELDLELARTQEPRHWITTRSETKRDAQGRIIGLRGTAQDISERMRAELALENANRALRTLSACNEALVRAGNEPELLGSICRLIVETGGYRMAWVGLAEHDAAKTVRPLAQYGDDTGYLAQANISWADTERGRGPTGAAIRTGSVQINRDFLTNPALVPWREAAIKSGYQSSIALPLKNSAGTFGVLTIDASAPDAFHEAEVILLRELADDLAFGIETLRTREERDRIAYEHQYHAEALRQSLEDSIKAVAGTLEMRDPYTAGHQRRVGQLAVAISKELGVADETIHGIELAASIHDLGKISVPADILSKPSKLTKIEFMLIQNHAQAGYDILKDSKFPWPIATMVLQHHERLDGSGYPQGLKRDQILLESRILAVADVVEAMSSHRPYRPGLGIDVALAQIRKEAGSKLDAEVVDACERVFHEQGFLFANA